MRFRLLAICLLIPLLLTACGDEPKPALRSGRDVPHVYATTYPLAFLAERIGGEHAKVISPLPASQDPATWRPAPDVIARFQDDADLIVVQGAGYERWVERASLPQARVCNTTSGLKTKLLRHGAVVKHTHGGEEHEHQGTDGLTWMDPNLLLTQAGAVHIHLRSRFPQHAEGYDARYKQLMGEIQELITAHRDLGRQPADGWVFAAHRAYAYPAQAFGWRVHDLDLDPATPPSDEDLAEIRKRLSVKPAKYLWWPYAPTDAVIQRISARTGLQSVIVPIHATPPSRGDLLSALRENLERMRPAFGPEPPPEPIAADPEAIDLDEMFRLLASADTEDREWAVYRLGVDFTDTQLAAVAERLVKALTGALEDASDDVRRGAVAGLGRLGDAAKPALPALARRMADREIPVRAQAADSLGRLGRRAAAHADILLAALADPSAVVRHNAAHALSLIGSVPDGLDAALAVRATKDEDDEVRAQAVLTIGELKIDTEATRGALVAALKDPHSEVRASAAWAVGAVSLKTDEVVALLEALRKDENPETRDAAAATLKGWQPDK